MIIVGLLLIAFLIYVFSNLDNKSAKKKRESTISIQNDFHKSSIRPTKNHGLSETELEDVLDDIKFAKYYKCTTSDGYVEIVMKDYQISSVKIKNAVHRYPSIKQLLVEKTNSVPHCALEDLIDINRRMINIRKYLGLPISPDYDLSLLTQISLEKEVSNTEEIGTNNQNSEITVKEYIDVFGNVTYGEEDEHEHPVSNNEVRGYDDKYAGKIYVRDIEKISEFDEDSFAAFLDYMAHIMLRDLTDVRLEGYDRSTLTEMEPMLHRGYLEAHLARLIHVQNQFIVSSKEKHSKLLITYLSNGRGLLLQSLDIYGQHTLFNLIKNFDLIPGVFELDFEL